MTKTNINIEDRLHRKEDSRRWINILLSTLIIVFFFIWMLASLHFQDRMEKLEDRIGKLESETKLLKECLLDTLEINQRALRIYK